MNTLFGQTVFVVGERAYGWEDVVLAAQLRGDWAALAQQTRAGLACQQRLAAEGGELAQAKVNEAANEFRYDRDLISAQEITDWLKGWGLTTKQWMDYLRRDLLRQRWAKELKETLARFPVSEAELTACLQVEAVCSGQLRQMAERLAARLAARERQREAASETTAAVAAHVPDLAFHAAAWPGWSEATFREKAALFAQLEEAYQGYQQSALTRRALREQIQIHGLDWLKVAVEAVLFPSAAAASEAVFCIRFDGLSLADVAADAGQALHQAEFYLDDLNADLREVFLGLGSGELSEPVPQGKGFALYLMKEKSAPEESDAHIRRRAEAAVLASVQSRDVNQFVQWQQHVLTQAKATQ